MFLRIKVVLRKLFVLCQDERLFSVGLGRKFVKVEIKGVKKK